MPNDYTAEFRERVLRRVAERDDLDAVAREFGMPSDVIFAWLRDAVDGDRRLGAARPAATRAASDAAIPGVASTARSNRGLIAMVSIFGGSGLFMLMTGSSLGVVVASHAFEAVMVAVGVVIGLWMFVWLLRTIARDIAGDDSEVPLSNWVLLTPVVGALCCASVWMWTVTLPSYPHRFFRQPLEVRTTVVRMAVWNRKGGICPQITTAVFDTRFPAQEFCVDRQQYNDVRTGETVVLRGSVSWFGFKRDSVVFIPPGT